MQKAAQAYIQTQVTTTSQGDVLILLFDGALKFLKQAKERMAAKDYAQKGILISKVLDVIAELQGSLNMQKGGKLAENLSRLYFLCSTKLLAANLKMDQNLLDEVVGMLSGVRDAFAQINTPEFAPPPQSAARTQSLISTRPGLAPSTAAGASVHKAFAAYSHATKDAG
jgi:flagellar protein FliS